VSIQRAQNRRKNESLSKNKCLIFYQDLFANEKLFYKLFSVIQTIDKKINQQNGGRDIYNNVTPTNNAREI